jgi:hypothetical protein
MSSRDLSTDQSNDGVTKEADAAEAGGSGGARAEELRRAVALGLVVEDAPASPAASFMGVDEDGSDDEDLLLEGSSPISVLTDASARRRREAELAPARVVSATRRRWADEDSDDDDLL